MRDHLAHVVFLQRVVGHEAEQVFRVVTRFHGFVALERGYRRGDVPGQRADAFEAGGIVLLAEVDRARHRGVQFGTADLLGVELLAERLRDQTGAGEEQSAAFGHQHGVAHDRQVRAAGDAHAHDRRDLRNALRAHHRVVAEDAAEVVLIGEHLVLHRQVHTRAVHEVDRRQMALQRDVLVANDLLGGHRKKRAARDRRVVGDHHEQATVHAGEAANRSRRGRLVVVHAAGGVDPEFEELAVVVDELRDALARGQATLLVLRLDAPRAAAGHDLELFGADLVHAFADKTPVAAQRIALQHLFGDLGLEDVA